MTAIATPRHRVGVATEHVHAELDAVADASVWSMDPVETGQTLVALQRAEARLVELKARVAVYAEDLHVGQEVGASSAANWLADQTKATRSAAYAAGSWVVTSTPIGPPGTRWLPAGCWPSRCGW
ncbi:hypothetical protein [Nocardioides sp. HB32]